MLFTLSSRRLFIFLRHAITIDRDSCAALRLPPQPTAGMIGEGLDLPLCRNLHQAVHAGVFDRNGG